MVFEERDYEFTEIRALTSAFLRDKPDFTFMEGVNALLPAECDLMALPDGRFRIIRIESPDEDFPYCPPPFYR